MDVSLVSRCPTVDHGVDLAKRYRAVRSVTEWLCQPLGPEDSVVQSMPDASPAKWHQAHTTWFFETFLLASDPSYESPDPSFRVLYNSYYNGVGAQHPRHERGLLSRPTLDEIRRFRRFVDEKMVGLIERRGDDAEFRHILEVGLHHEQQHQELILMDIKHLLSCNPSMPVYRDCPESPRKNVREIEWRAFEGGVRRVGHSDADFAYDNEQPRHRVFVEPFEIASRLVTQDEYRAFIEDDGYRRPEFWLADGWSTVEKESWSAPLYWRREDGGWKLFSLSGLRDMRGDEPVCHVSHYEADAFARWSGARLPTEFEWETAADGVKRGGNFVESGLLHPAPASNTQMYGDVWEWTASPYVAYPGFRPADGALGEYNGKFMSNQIVLRGGSCGTSQSHVRSTYRNFFYPHQRWQFGGIRLAR